MNLITGQTLALGRNSIVKLDSDVTGVLASDDNQAALEDVQEIIEKILAGDIDELEAPAAGEETDISSSSQGGVEFERTGATGEVTSGFDTSANDIETTPVELRDEAEVLVEDAPQLAAQPEPEPEPIVASLALSATQEVAEGGELVYIVTVSEPAVTDLDIQLSNGESINIPAGSSSGSVTLNAPTDDVYIDPSNVSVNITGVTGGGYDDINITNDNVVTSVYDTIDTTVISITGDETVAEGEEATYTISISNPVPAGETVTVPVTYTYQSAESGDIITNTTEVVLDAANQSVDFTVAAVDDAYAEGDEVYSVVIGTPVDTGSFENVELGNDTVATTIKDGNDNEGTPGDDDKAIVSISGDASVVEGNDASYTVSVDKAVAAGETVTVPVTYTYQSAESGDIITNTTEVVLDAANQSVDFTVAAVDDAYAEGDEVYSVVIGTPVDTGSFENVELGNDTVATTIKDGNDNEGTPGDDDKAIVSISGDASVVEGNDASYTVSVDKAVAAGETVTVPVTYTYQSAESGDIITNTTEVVLDAANQSVDFTVAAVDDAYAEGDEVYSVVIGTPVDTGSFENVELGNDTVATTIKDGNDNEGTPGDDDKAIVSISGDASVVEGNDASYTVSVDKAVAAGETALSTLTV